jgi:RNA polymerase sigma-70 factor (ECF subfamily)
VAFALHYTPYMNEPRSVAVEVDAIDQLFRTHGAMVRGLLLRMVGPVADLEDLLQTTFLEGMRSIERYRGDAKPSTWICGIAAHVARHYLRAKRVRRHVTLDLVPDVELGTTSVEERERSLDEHRVAARLGLLLERIQPNKRDALLAYVLDDRAVEDIASEMRATQTATRSRMFFARRELRALVAADPELSEHAAGLMRRSGTPRRVTRPALALAG